MKEVTSQEIADKIRLKFTELNDLLIQAESKGLSVWVNKDEYNGHKDFNPNVDIMISRTTCY